MNAIVVCQAREVDALEAFVILPLAFGSGPQYHEDVMNFIKGCETWDAVVSSIDFGKYISSRMKWAEDVFNCRAISSTTIDNMRPWQEELQQQLLEPANDRDIIWYFDQVNLSHSSNIHHDTFSDWRQREDKIFKARCVWRIRSLRDHNKRARCQIGVQQALLCNHL